MRAALAALTLLLVLTSGPALAGSSVRYALVVGSNQANSPDVPLEDLRHAEAEAYKVHQHLLQFANFDPDRALLVTGTGRQDVMLAAKKLAQQHKQDQKELGSLPTLFAFFFTGHGLSGKLLTRDDPITGEDLASIFQEMDASLTIGFFDACFSESLDIGGLQGKGAISTPGFNPITELPKEVLNSEGTVWFVSSRPDEQSYEDDRFGGLFTHYFLEAFTEAPVDGVAITLDQMWEYSRRRTTAHAAKYNRTQTPVKIVRNLRARGPLYFSFPSQRTATVRFDSEIAGKFLVQYQHGALAERVTKQSGQPLEVALYEGEVILSRLDQNEGSDVFPSQRLQVSKGSVIRVRPRGATSITTAPGYSESPIRSKGSLKDLELTEEKSAATVGLGLGYGLRLAQPGLLSGLHRVQSTAYYAFGSLSLELGLAYGYNSATFETWNYQLHQANLRALAGYGFRFGPVRLDLEAGVEPSVAFVSYNSGQNRQAPALWLGTSGRAAWTLPFPPAIALTARLGVGALASQGLAARDLDYYWSPTLFAELGASLPLWHP